MKSFDKIIKKEFKLLWEMSSEIHLPEPPNTDDSWMEMEQLIERNEVKTKLSPARFYSRRIFSTQPRFAYVIAAVLMLTLLCQPAYLWLTTESFITDRGEQISFNLPDDSKIRLNAESELTFRSSFNEKSRLVTLSGEAYFDVQSGSHPFIIQHEDVSIRVVGTQFNVRTIENEIEVAVNEGIVLVSNDQTQETITVLEDPAHRNARHELTDAAMVKYYVDVKGMIIAETRRNDNPVHITKGQFISFSKKESPGTPEAIGHDQYPGWIYNKFIFDQENLSVVCKEIERKFDVDIELESDGLETITVTGVIDAKDLSRVLHTLSSLINRSYKFDNKRYTFY
jgi:ferric-dicitrate binding protein FerR (iron transport regulator)